MLGRDLFRPYPETHFDFASMDRRPGVSTQHTPRQNRLLAALPLEDYERLLPDLEPVPLPPGWIVHGAGEPENHLYFLTAGIVSRFYVTQNGASAEFAVTGSEGVIGIASFLSGASMPSQAVVLSAGYAYRLGADLLQSEFEHDGPLPHLLLRYTQALIAQTGQIAVCNRHHPLEQQLCRWILSILDRLPSNELAMTQELIADMLGVRRESVTEAAGKLQKAGLIHYSRGHIAVLDRARLEAQVCECYAVVKREYDRLLPNIGKPKSLVRAAPATLAPIGAIG
jgi:CRP-like cAMP-binding protein